jgi:RecB family exonuclease
MLSISLEFMGWDCPALPEAARRLAARYRQASMLDLGHVVVVVPGQRAGRRLQELLAFLAEDEKLRLTPPITTTESTLPEMLYTPRQPFADDIAQELAWAQVLRNLPADQRKHVVPHPPGDAEAVRWLHLGRIMRKIHVELAADGLDFVAVGRHGPNVSEFPEAERWQALVTLQRRYLDLLDRERLWDKQTARLKAIEFREIATECDIILLGTVDLNNSLRQMLEQIAGRVTAYIIAPQSFADRFDAFGCLVPRAWCDAPIPLRDDQLEQVDGPAEQTDAVSRWLAVVGGRFRKDEVAIGVPDESLVPQLQRELTQCGVPSRWVLGVQVGATAAYRLLESAIRFAGSRRYDDLASLVRHPDLEDWLRSSAPDQRAGDEDNRSAKSLPAQLDAFYNARLPSRVRATDVRDNDVWPDLGAALERIEAWLEAASAPHTLRAWGDVFCAILEAVYGGRTLNRDKWSEEVLHRTIAGIIKHCDGLDSLPEALDTAPMSAADVFQIALGPLGDETLPPPADPDAVEILGWLELPLDDAPALIVTSFNEGLVPKSAGADAFLPDRLRRELGLLHNERRYARDAFATSVLCHSRQELRVLFARRDTQKNPLQPSRLIFACPDDQLIGRGQQFFGESNAPAAPRRLLLATGGAIPEKSTFVVPRPIAEPERLERVSVSQFKSYLSCRYRYYLRHVRALKAVDDSARELDGGAFGTLLHKVLGAFGRDPGGPRHSDREREIFDYLANQLDAIYRPDQRRPAVRLQLEQARARLGAFASRQAALVREGWRIAYAEDDELDRLSVEFVVDGEPIKLEGRIDRIDIHESGGAVRIVDYKTADRAQVPDKTHRKGETWIDLQLPMYRHLWQATLEAPPEYTVELGYFNLPKDRDQTDAATASWDDAALAAADEAARQVIRMLRDAVFWGPVYPAPDFSEDLAAICLDNVFSRPVLDDDEPGGAP